MRTVLIAIIGPQSSGKTALTHALAPGQPADPQQIPSTAAVRCIAARLPDGVLAQLLDAAGDDGPGAGGPSAGIDISLLTVAADAPCTAEAMERVRSCVDAGACVLALTKCDLVDRERLRAAEHEIRSLLADTPQANAPLVRVSAASGRGLNALRRVLMSAASRIPPRNSRLPFRLIVDEVAPGSDGSVVATGALLEGRLRVGDRVEIVPDGDEGRIGRLEVCGWSSGAKGEAAVVAGCRVSVQLIGLAARGVAIGGVSARGLAPAVSRGSQIVVPGADAAADAAPDQPSARLLQALLDAPAGMTRAKLAAASGIAPADLSPTLSQIVSGGRAVALRGGRLIHETHLRRLTDLAEWTLEGYHARFPRRPGMPKAELRASLDVTGTGIEPAAFDALLSYWLEGAVIVTDGDAVRRAAFRPAPTDRQRSLLARIREVYMAAGLLAPTTADVSAAVGAPPEAVEALLRAGMESGDFDQVAEGVYYLPETLRMAEVALREFLAGHERITTAQFRDLTHTSRRIAELLLDYFDGAGLTERSVEGAGHRMRGGQPTEVAGPRPAD
jgi:hypothetical protein